MFRQGSETFSLVCEPLLHRYVAGAWLRLSLANSAANWPRGVVLINLQMHCHGERGLTRLRLVDGDFSERELVLPVSRRGRLLELLHLDDCVTELWLQPMSGQGWCVFEELSIRPQQGLEAATRRLQRVLPMLWRQPRALRHRVGLRSHLVLSDLTAAYARAGELRDYAPDSDYRRWTFLHNQLAAEDRTLISAHITRWRQSPRFLIEINEFGGGDASITHASLEAQLYKGFSLRKPGDLIDADPNQWVLSVSAGVRLSDHALYWLACEIQAYPEFRALYADHDYFSEDLTAHSPCFKPDCSQAFLACMPYVGPVVGFRADALAATSLNNRYTAMLLLSQQPKRVGHVSAVLYHVPEGLDWRNRELERTSLHTVYPEADVEVGLCGHWRLRHPLPAKLPVISIIVPTRDNFGVLKACVESVLTKSGYPNFELLVVDNQSTEPDALAYLAQLKLRPKVRVLKYAQAFNFSAINNWAVSQATGDIVCLLNNDTEVISPDWVEEMLAQLLQHNVGVVGAKLYYTDGRVQHAGDAVGPGGCADHFFNGVAHDDPGYMDRSMLVQDLSAVTAACLMTHRDLYRQLGGLNESDLPIAFNDVDYCLRVRELGQRVVWTPYAELYHHESVTRGKDDNPEKQLRASKELAYMRRRWKHVLKRDPFYNPNLSYDRPDFSLSRHPRVTAPWHHSRWRGWRR